MTAVLDRVRRVVRAVSLALLAALVLTPLAQIVMRGAFDLPFSGAEELARYFLICLTFVGASYVTTEDGQIKMAEIQALLPGSARWRLQLVIEASGVAIYSILFVAACVTVSRNLDNQTATLEMPFWIFFAPLVIGALLLSVETAVWLVRLWRQHRPADKHTTLA
jgi:TRAP-type C4-dicarboxylate transport system permease small subunit